jgi:PAS domain-containing protein
MEISLALKNLTQFSGEILNYRKDTTIFWNELTITPIFDEQGQLSNFISTTHDITKRKQVQEALSLTQTRLNFAVECSGIGAWDFDLINNTSWRSLWHDRIFGYETPPSEWNAIIALRHVVREDRKRILACINQAFQTGKLFLECRIIQPDQSQRWINVKGHVFYDEQAQPIRILGTVEDVTDYKTEKEKEHELLEKLAQVGRHELMNEMASGIAHEVNQPLSAIANYAQAGIKIINTEKPDQ